MLLLFAALHFRKRYRVHREGYHVRRAKALERPQMAFELVPNVLISEETMIMLLSRARRHEVPSGGSGGLACSRHR